MNGTWRTAKFTTGERVVLVMPEDGAPEKWSLRIEGNADVQKVIQNDTLFFKQNQYRTMKALGFEIDAARARYGKACGENYVRIIIRLGRIVRCIVNGVTAETVTITNEDNMVLTWEPWEGELYEERRAREKREAQGSE